ncbi:MAG: prepilin peptidase [Kiritimatiellae bacterium]|nr:prepilin peptidase [Kiritimatiellia bacterium]
MFFAIAPALVWGVILSWVDCRKRRLPNWLTIGVAAVALTWRFGYGGPDLFLRGFVAAVVAGLFLMIPFLMRGAGGGDIKMLFAAGAIVGWEHLLMLLWMTSLAGVIFGVVMIISGHLDGSRVKHSLRCLLDWRYDRKAGAAGLPAKDNDRVRVPFSIPITVGMISAMILG